jgi:hypothetical protein
MDRGSRGFAQDVRRPGPSQPLTTTYATHRRPHARPVGRARRSRLYDGKAAATARGGTRRGIRVRRRCATGTGKGEELETAGPGMRGGHRRGAPTRDRSARPRPRRHATARWRGRAGRASWRAGSLATPRLRSRAVLPSRLPEGSGRRTRVVACGKPRDAGGSAHDRCCRAVCRRVRGAGRASWRAGSLAMPAVALTGDADEPCADRFGAAGRASWRARAARPQRQRTAEPCRPTARTVQLAATGDAVRPTRAECGGDEGLWATAGMRRRTRHIPLPRPRYGGAAHARAHSVASTMPMSRRLRA